MVSAIWRLTLGGGVAVLLGAQSAAAAVTAPNCAAMLPWATTVNLADKSYLVTPALGVPAALADDKLAPVFGEPMLAWSKTDSAAVGKALGVCAQEAKKARDQAAMTAYAAAYNAVLKTIPWVVTTVTRSRDNAAKLKAQIDGLPDSPALDRGLQALLQGDPAAPNPAAYQGLERAIVDPLFRLAREVTLLPAGDRESLHAALVARRTQIQASVGTDAKQQVAAATPDVAGIFALMQLARQVGGVDAAVDAAIAARATEIRSGLRSATPAAWVPPACDDLYRWAGQQEGNKSVQLGRYPVLAVFADEASSPVFNLPIAGWRDDDLTSFKTLRGLCQQAWQALPNAQSVNNPAPDAPELLRLASKGRWIDGADSQIQQARTTATNYLAAKAGMEKALADIQALPDSNESLQPLAGIGQTVMSFQALDDNALRGLQVAVQTKRNRIFAGQLEAGLAALKQVEVAKLDDLPKLINTAAQAGRQIMDGNAQQRFFQTYEQLVVAAVAKLAPAFQAELERLPASRDGLLQTGDAVARLTNVTDTERVAAFGALHQAQAARAQAIVGELREANCKLLHDELDMSDNEAAQPVWGPGKPITMGEMVCRLAASGMEVNGYDGGGMFSKTQSIKVTMPMGGLQTISLKKGEVAAGQEMLVGFKIADANQEKTLPVQEWEMLMHTTGEQIVTVRQCDPVMTVAEKELKAAQRMLALDCALAAASGRLY